MSTLPRTKCSVCEPFDVATLGGHQQAFRHRSAPPLAVEAITVPRVSRAEPIIFLSTFQAAVVFIFGFLGIASKISSHIVGPQGRLCPRHPAPVVGVTFRWMMSNRGLAVETIMMPHASCAESILSLSTLQPAVAFGHRAPDLRPDAVLPGGRMFPHRPALAMRTPILPPQVARRHPYRPVCPGSWLRLRCREW